MLQLDTVYRHLGFVQIYSLCLVSTSQLKNEICPSSRLFLLPALSFKFQDQAIMQASLAVVQGIHVGRLANMMFYQTVPFCSANRLFGLLFFQFQCFFCVSFLVDSNCRSCWELADYVPAMSGTIVVFLASFLSFSRYEKAFLPLNLSAIRLIESNFFLASKGIRALL